MSRLSKGTFYLIVAANVIIITLGALALNELNKISQDIETFQQKHDRLLRKDMEQQYEFLRRRAERLEGK